MQSYGLKIIVNEISPHFHYNHDGYDCRDK